MSAAAQALAGRYVHLIIRTRCDSPDPVKLAEELGNVLAAVNILARMHQLEPADVATRARLVLGAYDLNGEVIG
jgi:NTP pyrophosphatase (non-canonical NTP hydrolase)